jgi:CO dehydrogenase/acetyl-CoA synthase alpha subunit
MQLIRTIDGIKYVFVPLSDLDKIKDILKYTNKMREVSKCAKACPVMLKIKEIAEGIC